jgi:hypothetical protein
MQPTPQLQFLQNFDQVTDEHADLHLSAYNLEKVRKLKKLSKLRWVQGTDLKLKPGTGSGTIKIGQETFKVTYAWGGREEPGQLVERTSYTVRVTGPDLQKRIAALKQQIILDENGKTYNEVTYREHSAKGGTHSLADFIQTLKPLHRMFDVKQMESMVNGFKERWTKNELVKEYIHMRNIETDMLETKPKNP